MANTDIKSMTMQQLEKEIADLGEPRFRAGQIFEWLHKKGVASFDEMSNLSKPLRSKLAEAYDIRSVKIVKKLESRQDMTIKYLLDVGDSTIIECVLMPYDYGNAICISTQAGCKMNCVFCASAIGGFLRNLTASEMLSQVYEVQKDSGLRVSGIVLMGSGEPLDNYEQTLRFIRIINDKNGMNIGQRHITISTCGLVDKIYDLAQEGLQCGLAISLHAPNDEIRRQLMPIAKCNNYVDLMDAAKYYANTTKRRVTYEYAMIKGVNDSIDCAKTLGHRIRHTLAHVNLIPLNVSGSKKSDTKYEKSSTESINDFAELLKSYGIETTIRRRLGSDINGACGQLRLNSYTE